MVVVAIVEDVGDRKKQTFLPAAEKILEREREREATLVVIVVCLFGELLKSDPLFSLEAVVVEQSLHGVVNGRYLLFFSFLFIVSI